MPTATSPLFFALPAPAEVRALAARFQEELRRCAAPARFPPLEGLHITLAFLGQVDPGAVPALMEAARAAAGKVRAFPLRTAGQGGFPRSGQARVLWLGFEPEPALAQLAEELGRSLQAGGIPFDAKPFLPHLTLARFRAPVDLGRLPGLRTEPVRFPVGRFALYQSVATAQGPRYQELGSVELPARSA